MASMSDGPPCPQLLETLHVVQLLWPVLSTSDRLAMFFVSRATRNEVLATARQLTCDLHADWDCPQADNMGPSSSSAQLTALAVNPSSAARWLRVMQPVHAAGVPLQVNVPLKLPACAQRQQYPAAASAFISYLCQHVLSQVGASVRGLSVTYGWGVDLTTDHLAALGQHAPHVRSVTVTCSDGLCPALPPPSTFPALRQLTMSQERAALSPTCVDSISPYLPQLTHLTLPTFTLPQLTTLLLTTPAPAAPKLTHLTTYTPLSDDLMQLLTSHTPQLHDLGVSTLPAQPLQHPPPTTLHALTFTSLPAQTTDGQHCLCAIHHVPETVTGLHWDIHRSIDLELSRKEADQCPALVSAVQRLTSVRPAPASSGRPGVRLTVCPARQLCCTTTDNELLHSLMQIADAFPSLESLILRQWDMNEDLVETLCIVWPQLTARRIVVDVWWHPHSPLWWVLGALPDACEDVEVVLFEHLVRADKKELKERLDCIRDLLDSTPTDRTVEHPLRVAVQLKGNCAFHQEVEVEGALRFWGDPCFPNVRFDCSWVGETERCSDSCMACLEREFRDDFHDYGELYDDDDDDDYYDYMPW